MTPFGKHQDKSIKQLTQGGPWIVRWDDAGWREGAAPRGVLQQFNGRDTWKGRDMIPRRACIARDGACRDCPWVNVENACRQCQVLRFHLAVNYVKAGARRHCPRDRRGEDVLGRQGTQLQCVRWCLGCTRHGFRQTQIAGDGSGNRTSFREHVTEAIQCVSWISMHPWAECNMREFGTTQRHFAAVAAKNHRHSVHNPLAPVIKPHIRWRKSSPAAPITYPLTLPMLARPSATGLPPRSFAAKQGLFHAQRAIGAAGHSLCLPR